MLTSLEVHNISSENPLFFLLCLCVKYYIFMCVYTCALFEVHTGVVAHRSGLSDFLGQSPFYLLRQGPSLNL